MLTPLTTGPAASDFPNARPGRARRLALLAAALLALGGLAAYQHSFGGPFIYDDAPSIVENPTIRHLWPLTLPLSPPRGTGVTVNGRPVLNLSLAINYALSGDAVWSYHALNLAVHLLAGLTLFGIIRRTLVRMGRVVPNLPGAAANGSNRRVRDNAPYLPEVGDVDWVALAIAVLWTVHPLQTESVTYVVQRAESLMGLFYLLTLYCFIRAADCHRTNGRSGRGREIIWQVCSVVCCLLGMATKEVMVTAPVMVLLYDRTFASGGFAAAWRRHWRLYLGLAATWLLLAFLVAGTGGNRGGSVGFGVGVSWWAYALTQFPAIARYLLLALWPHPLVFDYGSFWVKHASEAAGPMLVVGAVIAGTAAALWRRPALGFAGAWFLGILAPTSLVPGTTQMVVEHRTYLPLAAIVAVAGVGIQSLAGRRGLLALGALAAALGWLTFQRNADYRSALAIWSDTAAKRPDNGLVQNNLGNALLAAGRVPDAIDHFELARRIDPADAKACNNLGNALLRAGRVNEALNRCAEAVRLDPDMAAAHYNLGYALLQTGRVPDAIREFEEALRLGLDTADLHYNLGNALIQTNRITEAIPQFAAAVQRAPSLAPAHGNLANALSQVGRLPEAIAQYEQALRLKPADADMHFNFGTALGRLGQTAEARREFHAVLRLRPDDAEARRELARLPGVR